MPRISTLNPAVAEGEAKALLDGVKATIGVVPNIFATFAHSPRLLEGYLAFSKSLSRGVLPARLREQIALTVAGANACDYCASAHTVMGKAAGLTEAELARNLQGQASDKKAQVALNFVRKVVDQRGRVADADVHALAEAGFGEAEIVEIIAHIGVNLFTNYFNHIVGTEIDFPLVNSAEGQKAA